MDDDLVARIAQIHTDQLDDHWVKVYAEYGCGSDEDGGWNYKGKWCGEKGICSCSFVGLGVMHVGLGETEWREGLSVER